MQDFENVGTRPTYRKYAINYSLGGGNFWRNKGVKTSPLHSDIAKLDICRVQIRQLNFIKYTVNCPHGERAPREGKF